MTLEIGDAVEILDTKTRGHVMEWGEAQALPEWTKAVLIQYPQYRVPLENNEFLFLIDNGNDTCTYESADNLRRL